VLGENIACATVEHGLGRVDARSGHAHHAVTACTVPLLAAQRERMRPPAWPVVLFEHQHLLARLCECHRDGQSARAEPMMIAS